MKAVTGLRDLAPLDNRKPALSFSKGRLSLRDLFQRHII
jgi:hypothetical protein